MKRMFFIFIILVGIISLCFANITWKFESGSKELGYKVFDSVTVINKTGKTLQVENEAFNLTQKLYFKLILYLFQAMHILVIRLKLPVQLRMAIWKCYFLQRTDIKI